MRRPTKMEIIRVVKMSKGYLLSMEVENRRQTNSKELMVLIPKKKKR